MHVKIGDKVRDEILRVARYKGISMREIARRVGLRYMTVWSFLRHGKEVGQDTLGKIISVVGGELKVNPPEIKWPAKIRRLLKYADEIDDNT